jgi:hypothetical protein
VHHAAAAAITVAVLALSGPARCAEPGAESGGPWSFSLTGFYYFPRQGDNFGLAIGQARQDLLLLEARYNYEALDTGSLWVGRTFAGGEALTWEVTPMVGAVFGELTGAAPGVEASLAWRKLDFYIEAEYVFDFDSQDNNFFYAWSELGYSPFEWLRLGLVVQRTQLYRSDLDLQRGPFVQFTLGKAVLGFYAFNLGSDDQVAIVSLAVSF